MAWHVDIDGTDITGICQSINWHPRWSRPATCVVKYPAHLYSCAAGAEMHLWDSGTLKFSGPVWHVQAEGQPNRTDAEITAYDHLIYLTKRLCKQPAMSGTGIPYPAPGALVEVAVVLLTEITAPEIMAAFLNSAIQEPVNNPAAVGSAPLPLSLGTVDPGLGTNCSGAPATFPMSIDQMRQLLLSTGQLAVNVHPGIGSSVVDFVAPPITVGAPVQTFAYQTGSFNSQNATVTDDMDEMVNALWYLLGPRGPAHHVRQDGKPIFVPVNHWGGSITPTAANAGGDGDGIPGGFNAPPLLWPSETVARFKDSRAQYGYMQEIRIFDNNEDEDSIRHLYEEQWNNEAWIRAVPRRFVGIRPERGVNPAFNVGDFIGMAGGSRLHGGVSGTLQVFEFEVEINVNGVVAITEIVASDDESGAPSLGS